MRKPMFGCNADATLVDGVTARTIVAAPGIATEMHYIMWIMLYNETTGENPIFKLYDSGQTLFQAKLSDIGDTQYGNQLVLPGWGLIVLPTPIICTPGSAIFATSTTAVGDVRVHVGGYTGEAGLTP